MQIYFTDVIITVPDFLMTTTSTL